MRRLLVNVLVVGGLLVAGFGAAEAATKPRKDTAKPVATRTLTKAAPAKKAPAKTLKVSAAKRVPVAPLVTGGLAWHTVGRPGPGPARAIGGYAAGCLAGGEAVAGEGAGYQVIRLSRNRNWGHPVLVDFVRDFGRRVAVAGLGTALIADMAQPRGGPMSFGHASHQSGLDADVWLRLDLPPMGRNARESVEEIKYVDYDRRRVTGDWTRGQAEMIRIAASDPRVERIFINPAIKMDLCRRDWPARDWLRKVRPWHGHDGHMHVRLSCPPGSDSCEPQRELPEGEGCGDDLMGWLYKAVPAMEIPPERARPPRPNLPPACYALLRSGTAIAAMPAAGDAPTLR